MLAIPLSKEEAFSIFIFERNKTSRQMALGTVAMDELS